MVDVGLEQGRAVTPAMLEQAVKAAAALLGGMAVCGCYCSARCTLA